MHSRFKTAAAGPPYHPASPLPHLTIMKRLAIAALLTLAAQASAQDARPIDEFRRLMVVGDGRAALAALGRDPAHKALHGCVAGRIEGSADEPVPAQLEQHPAAWAIVRAYRGYWRAALSDAGDAARAGLLARLNQLLPGQGWDRTSLDAATNEAKRRLEGMGLRAITGVTWPYYELMLWTAEDRREFRVDLSDQVVTVPVVFMDGFISKGWLSYGSCERFGAGGWTASGTLYAIRSRYDLDSEAFRVSYLGHEGRHFADNRDHPGLEQPELEYRAKLTELVLSRDSTRRLFDQFLHSGQRGRGAPHAHAEYWLVRHLEDALLASASRAGWAGVPDQRLREAAAALLAASTGQAGRFLPD